LGFRLNINKNSVCPVRKNDCVGVGRNDRTGVLSVVKNFGVGICGFCVLVFLQKKIDLLGNPNFNCVEDGCADYTYRKILINLVVININIGFEAIFVHSHDCYRIKSINVGE
jgi:hypothetical protein